MDREYPELSTSAPQPPGYSVPIHNGAGPSYPPERAGGVYEARPPSATPIKRSPDASQQQRVLHSIHTTNGYDASATIHTPVDHRRPSIGHDGPNGSMTGPHHGLPMGPHDNQTPMGPSTHPSSYDQSHYGPPMGPPNSYQGHFSRPDFGGPLTMVTAPAAKPRKTVRAQQVYKI
jgi:hypothetical protein